MTNGCSELCDVHMNEFTINIHHVLGEFALISESGEFTKHNPSLKKNNHMIAFGHHSESKEYKSNPKHYKAFLICINK